MGAGVESGNVSYCVRRESTTATAGRLRLQARYAAAAASGVRTARVQHYGTACNDQPPALRNSCTQLFPSALSERKVMGNLVTETLWCVAAAFAASRMPSVHAFARSFFAAVVYPTHSSLKAIQSGSREDSLQWLAYWVLHALLTSAEELFDAALAWCARAATPPPPDFAKSVALSERARPAGFRCTTN